MDYCNQCIGIEDLFNQQNAAMELKRYLNKGPSRTTRMLIDTIKASGVAGLSLLDIGGGVGAIQHELHSAGVQEITDVDASTAYLNTAKQEAIRQGYADHTTYHHGNFVELAKKIAPADIVTLDRVICCFNDMQSLVSLSAERARKIYGLVYPRDAWWVRIGMKLTNLLLKLQHSRMRTFFNPTPAVKTLLESKGLKRRFFYRTLVWQVEVYAR